tara:strand:+ start:214 stop:804 length:591 start_codon:yes stop_codon:yes gene_type:complete
MYVEELRTTNDLLIKGPLMIIPKVFSDERGFFLESWNFSKWTEILSRFAQQSDRFVQDNHSSSSRGVLRGLHYQLPPHPQGKLVRCISGEIFDVAIDLRKSSSTFLKGVGVHLTESNFKQLWIPKGFAHGFLTLSKHAEVLYKTTDFWNPDCERSILWNDSSLDIDWPAISQTPICSPKDSDAPVLKDMISSDFFE